MNSGSSCPVGCNLTCAECGSEQVDIKCIDTPASDYAIGMRNQWSTATFYVLLMLLALWVWRIDQTHPPADLLKTTATNESTVQHLAKEVSDLRQLMRETENELTKGFVRHSELLTILDAIEQQKKK